MNGLNDSLDGREIFAIPYRPQWDGLWDEFVDASQNGTIYHTRRFLSYHQSGRFDDMSVLLCNGKQVLAVAPAALVRKDGLAIYSLHPGASYGGPVLAENLSLAEVVGVVRAVVKYASDSGCQQVEMLRLPPKVYHKMPHDDLELCLTLMGFRLDRRELSAAISVPDPGQDVKGCLSGPCSWAVSKSIKEGVDVRFVNDAPTLAAYWSMLENTLAARHQAHPTHSLEEITRLVTVLCRDRISLLAAFYGGRIVAGVVFCKANRQTIYAVYSAQDYEFQRLRPTNLVFFRLLEWAQANGFRAVDLGVCTEGQSVNWGLYHFKESFGARGSLRDSYVLAC
jgi:hypothetical protein